MNVAKDVPCLCHFVWEIRVTSVVIHFDSVEGEQDLRKELCGCQFTRAINQLDWLVPSPGCRENKLHNSEPVKQGALLTLRGEIPP